MPNTPKSPWFGTGLLTAAALAVLFVLRAPASAPGFQAMLAAYDPVAVTGSGPLVQEDLVSVETIGLERGETPAGALVRAGLEASQVREVLAAGSEHLDPRTVRPADRFRILRRVDGSLDRVEYQRSPSWRLLIHREDSGYRAERMEIPVVRSLRKMEGEIRTSLHGSLIAQGAGEATVVEFAELFSWDFDFLTDTRQGDRFRLLVEERTAEGVRIGGRILAAEYHPHRASRPLTAFYYAWGEDRGESGYYDDSGKSLRKFFLRSPLSYRRISSSFSQRRFHPILKKHRPHLGIDYAAPTGTPVVALGNGRVVLAGRRGGFGKTIQIRHNRTYLTQYAHLSRYAKGIRSGVRVEQGQVIGYVGSTGLSTGPHLDFRVRENGRWVNPLRVSGGQAEPIPKDHREGYDRTASVLAEWLDRLPAGAPHRLAQQRSPASGPPVLDTRNPS